MAIPGMSSEQMRAALKEVDQAIYNHEQWSEALFASLACRLPPDERDLSDDAYRQCRFGQWYYGVGATLFVNHPGVAEIESEHKRMHQFAGQLLRISAKGEANSIQTYDQFVNALKRLRLEISTLKHELEDNLTSLDPLTGTPGRLVMLTKLREEQELVKRDVHACTISMLDIDHFKGVNDRYGHVVGDKVLVKIAQLLMTSLRPYDKVFRYGGEEFLIALPDTAPSEGFEIVERLRKVIEAIPHQSDREGVFQVTVSVGVAPLDPNTPVEQSIDRADKALYLAKEAGRNRTVTWDAAANAAAAAK